MNVCNMVAFEIRSTDTVGALFEGLFDGIEQVVKFRAEWHTGTGYFHLAAADAVDGIVGCKADDGRKVIIVNECGRRAIFFQRFLDSKKIICCHREMRPEGHVVGPFSDLDENGALEALVKAYNANQRRLEALASQR